MDALEKEWGDWWQVGRSQPPIEWSDDLGVRPPPPTTQVLKRVLMTCPAGTGCGYDHIPPR
eukprot:6484242-Pyramimonas_sp.AAC.1